MGAERILISINKNLLVRIDEHIERVGVGSSRSGFFKDAAEEYLLNHRGIMNIIRKRQLTNE